MAIVVGVVAATASALPAAGSTGARGHARAASGRRAHFSANADAIQSAYALAVGYWHRAPCGGHVAWGWTTTPGARIATAYWSSAAGDNPALYSNCSIVLHRSAATDWPKFCTVIVHEVGHLTGHGHVLDRSSVMYPFYIGPRGPCMGKEGGTTSVPGPAQPPANATPMAPNAPSTPSPPGSPQPGAAQPTPPQQPNPLSQLLGAI